MKKSTQHLYRFLITLVISSLSYLGLKKRIQIIETNLKNKDKTSNGKK